MITVASGLSYVDVNFLDVPGIIATAVLHGPGGVALIDPGPSSTLPALRSALRQAGIAPTDAVNVSQLSSTAAGFQTQVNSLQSQINSNQTEARAGIALALAAGALQYDQRPGKLSVAAAFGNFRGQNALASGLGYALTDRWRVNASFTATPQVSDYGFTVGSSWTLN